MGLVNATRPLRISFTRPDSQLNAVEMQSLLAFSSRHEPGTSQRTTLQVHYTTNTVSIPVPFFYNKILVLLYKNNNNSRTYKFNINKIFAANIFTS